MGRTTKWNIQSIQEYLDSTESGCKLISKEIRFMKDGLDFQCQCGNHFHRNFYNILHENSYYCDKCSKKIISERQKILMMIIY